MVWEIRFLQTCPAKLPMSQSQIIKTCIIFLQNLRIPVVLLFFFLEKESVFQREEVREWRHIVEVERVRQSLRER